MAGTKIPSESETKGKAILHVAIEPKMHDAIRELCFRQGKTLTEVAREAFGKYLAENGFVIWREDATR